MTLLTLAVVLALAVALNSVLALVRLAFQANRNDIARNTARLTEQGPLRRRR